MANSGIKKFKPGDKVKLKKTALEAIVLGKEDFKYYEQNYTKGFELVKETKSGAMYWIGDEWIEKQDL